MDNTMTEDNHNLSNIKNHSLYQANSNDLFMNHRIGTKSKLDDVFVIDNQHINHASQLHYIPKSFIDDANLDAYISSSPATASSADIFDSLAAGLPFLGMNGIDETEEVSIANNAQKYPLEDSLLRSSVENNDYKEAAMFFIQSKLGDKQEAVKFLRNVIFTIYTSSTAIPVGTGANGERMSYGNDLIQVSQQSQTSNFQQSTNPNHYSEIKPSSVSSQNYLDSNRGSANASYNPSRNDGSNGLNLANRSYPAAEKQSDYGVRDMMTDYQSMDHQISDPLVGTSPHHLQDGMQMFDDHLLQQQHQSITAATTSSASALPQLPPPTSTIQEIPMFGDEIDNRPSTLIMLVPGKPHIIGHLIGKGGVEIGRIEAETGVIVKIETQDKMPVGSMERRISIIGTIKSNVIAQQYISIKIQEKLLQEGIQQEILRLVVPNETVRHLIGKSGTNINKLQNESGARIQVEAESSMIPGSLGRTIVLQGTQLCRTHAQYLIARQMSEDRNLPPDWAGINKPSTQPDAQVAGSITGIDSNANNGVPSKSHQKQSVDNTGSTPSSSFVIHQSQRYSNHQAPPGSRIGNSKPYNPTRDYSKPNISSRGKHPGQQSMFQRATAIVSDNEAAGDTVKYSKKRSSAYPPAHGGSTHISKKQ